MNIDIFKQNTTNCDDRVDNCAYLNRIFQSIAYYESITKAEQIQIDKFIQFCHDTYTLKHILDDFCHFIDCHNDTDELLAIRNKLRNELSVNACDVTNCISFNRHYRISEIKDDESDLITDHFDRLHHHIFHIFELGLRISSSTINQENDTKDNEDRLCTDKMFEIVQKHKNAIGFEIERYEQKNNKYNLSTHQSKHTNDTFLDKMYTFIEQEIENDLQNALMSVQKYLSDNEYDTESLEEDLFHQYIQQSNICNDLAPSMVKLILDFTKLINVTKDSFDTGFSFDYWHFSNKDEQNNNEVNLRVHADYGSLKQEILESSFINVTQWNTKVLTGAMSYDLTEKVKNIRRCRKDNGHGIERNSCITQQHLQCIILYCGWSDLCTHFSATFRKKNELEYLKDLKQRHQKYYYFAKGLVESVLDFGVNNYYNKERGPFYCGVSCVLKVPSFGILLKGPCSTSVDKEVAIRFASRDGMIMQLQNDVEYEGSRQNFFDCSWISIFSEENERLFICCGKPIRIASIIKVDGGLNFQNFIYAFWVFDHMISGSYTSKSTNINISKNDVNLLHAMIKNQKAKHEFDGYIIDTFELFLFKKTELIINLHDLVMYFSKLSDLLMRSVGITEKWDRMQQKWISQIEETQMSYSLNMFDTSILSIFPNVKKIYINSTDDVGINVCRFNLSLLTPFFKSSTRKLIVKAKRNVLRPSYPTWLKNAYTDSKLNKEEWEMVKENDADTLLCKSQ